MMLAYPDLSLFCGLHRLTCSTTDGSWNHDAEWKEPEGKGHITQDSMHMKYLDKSVARESR